jgi:hypothetical protein
MSALVTAVAGEVASQAGSVSASRAGKLSSVGGDGRGPLALIAIDFLAGCRVRRS